MKVATLDGVKEIADKEEISYKQPTINPFDFVNAINYTKENLVSDDWSEKQYNGYIVNKALSFSSDTVIPANEMNCRPHIGKKLQFDFLINTIRPRKRFNKWVKQEVVEDLEVVKQYYKYNTEKAHQALKLLSKKQLQIIKDKMFTGGLNNGT